MNPSAVAFGETSMNLLIDVSTLKAA